MSVYKLWIEIDDLLLDDLLSGIVPLEIDEALLSAECLGTLLSLRASMARSPAEREIHHQEKISRLSPKVICPRCTGRGWTREVTDQKNTKDEDGCVADPNVLQAASALRPAERRAEKGQ